MLVKSTNDRIGFLFYLVFNNQDNKPSNLQNIFIYITSFPNRNNLFL